MLPSPFGRRTKRSDSVRPPRCWIHSECRTAAKSTVESSLRSSAFSGRRCSFRRSAAASTVIHRGRFHFLREAEIWYSRSAEDPSNENVITLSDEFYSEIASHPIPADLEAVRVLAAAPALLDLFLWLSYRCFVAKGPEIIPLFGPYGLTQQLRWIGYSRPSRFRAMLEQWLKAIRCLWPECPAMICADGKAIRIDRRFAILPNGEESHNRRHNEPSPMRQNRP